MKGLNLADTLDFLEAYSDADFVVIVDAVNICFKVSGKAS